MFQIQSGNEKLVIKDGVDNCSFPTKAAVQSDKQLTDAEGDGGVSRDDDGLVSTFGVSAIIDLKLQHQRKLSDNLPNNNYRKEVK